MAREMKDSGIAWIGKIPAEWQVAKAKYYIVIQHGTDPKLEGDIPVYGSGASSFKTCGEYKNGPTVLIGRKGATLHIPHYIEGKYWNVDTAFDVHANPDMYLRYYYYCAICFDYKFYISQTTLPGMTQTNYENMFLPIPSFQKQKEITDFLDYKCGEIDHILKRIQISIEKYKELKQAIITQAVTKGIRENRPMKDSGIGWVKRLPLEWNSVNPKALFTQRKDKAKTGERQLTASQQYGVIYQDEYMELTGTRVVTVQKDFDILKHVEAGDFVISMRSFQGGLEYSARSGSISSAYVMLCPNLELVYPQFFRWLLKSQLYINALQSTSDLVRDGQAMRYSNFAQVRLYTVPMEEQKEIADYLDKKCAEIDALIIQKSRLLSELEAYKKSLIYEYVTGKKEVRRKT